MSTALRAPERTTYVTAIDSKGWLRTSADEHQGSLMTRLTDEWSELAADPDAVASARRWLPEVEGRSIESLDDVLGLIGFRSRHDDGDADALMLRVVRIAAHDDLAARVVLQRVLAGVISIAVRRGRIAAGGTQQCFAEMAATMWVLIRTYPCDRRPGKVAANLLRDVEYQTFVRDQRRRSREFDLHVRAVAADLPSDHDDDETEALLVLADALRWARDKGMAAQDLRLLVELASGRHPDEVAESLGCTARTVRNRRRELASALRSALVDGDVRWPVLRPAIYQRWDAASRWGMLQNAVVPGRGPLSARA